MISRKRQVIRWIGSFIFLLWTVVTNCHGQGSVHSVSLNMDGLLNITTNRSTDAVAVICRVIHNSTERSTFFYLNGTELKNAHPLNVDRTVRVTQYENCFLPPSNPQEQCEELTLVLRTVDVMNNTRITCRSRPRDSPGMLQVQSPETVTVIFRDPDIEDPDSCSPPSPSLHPPNVLTASPTSTPEPNIDTSKSDPIAEEVISECKEVGIALVAVLLCLFCLILICCICCLYRKNSKQKYKVERSLNLPHIESEDTKEETFTTRSFTSPHCISSEVQWDEELEPRTEQISDV